MGLATSREQKKRARNCRTVTRGRVKTCSKSRLLSRKISYASWSLHVDQRKCTHDLRRCLIICVAVAAQVGPVSSACLNWLVAPLAALVLLEGTRFSCGTLNDSPLNKSCPDTPFIILIKLMLVAFSISCCFCPFSTPTGGRRRYLRSPKWHHYVQRLRIVQGKQVLRGGYPLAVP